MAKLIVKPRGAFDYFDQLEGNSPFIKAVNKKLSDYWVACGGEMPIETAAFEVLGDLYDDMKRKN